MAASGAGMAPILGPLSPRRQWGRAQSQPSSTAFLKTASPSVQPMASAT